MKLKHFDPVILKLEQIRIDNELSKLYEDPTYDGIVDEQKYSNSALKILWILKEVNDEGGYNQRESLRNEITMESRKKGWWKTLDPVIYISYSILNNFMTWKDLSYISDMPEMIDVLKQIAYINIKKEAGGAVSFDNIISEGYQKYKDIIHSQIEMANPDIIIGGNTLQYLYEDFGISENQIKAVNGFDLGYFDLPDRLFINSYHPNYLMRMKESERGEYFDAITNTVKNWQVSRKS